MGYVKVSQIKTMSNFEKKVLEIIIYNPDTFNKILKNHNHQYVKSIIKKWFGNRIGLEFETATYNEKNDFIWKKYKLIDIDHQSEEKTISFNEKGLIGFNQFLYFLKKKVAFNESSGIHIHINCKKKTELIICEKYKYVLEYLIKLFEYKGTYNRHEISLSKTAIRIHGQYNTLEYRIIPMSYDWDYLIKSIIILQYISEKMNNLQEVDLNFCDSIWKL